MNPIVILNDADTVATSLVQLAPDARIEVTLDGQAQAITVRDEIPFGHKIAVRAMPVGAQVLKYGEVIGQASRAISPGEWVHVHNVESVRARGDLR